ncbi:NTP transferase domain-containing protein [Streptomyces sp. PKU-MA01144]|uniref:NTP transferase domain-containing protein n=1 Tax=Streptomyces sp. PKU-MA01144 TaxID=2729138 RepID=UPI00147CD820|nr:NTP transferase domain-containing protein [Streptomyces sp. PKU-MA01144]NNJ02885.1 NTP transferase domain-containing protein [Streptomyces sp. PKU-MA01144]
MTADAEADYDAIVLAGGGARRLGGADKPGVTVGGRTLLDRVLTASRGAHRTIVVGARRPTARPVTWTRETPPGGGPLAALRAGLRRCGAPVVVVLSADLPFLDDVAVHRLLDALHSGGQEGALLVDADGRDQPLVAAYRTEPLHRELALIAAEHGGLSGLPLRLLTGELDLCRVAAEPLTAYDCDTWEDIVTARARIREHGNVLDEWITSVKDELGIDLEVDTDLLLDLARDAAHGVARPAAPLTTFLVGYAAARAGGDGARAVAEAARRASALAERWAAEAADAGNADAGNADAGNADAGNADAGNAEAGNADAGRDGADEREDGRNGSARSDEAGSR